MERISWKRISAPLVVDVIVAEALVLVLQGPGVKLVRFGDVLIALEVRRRDVEIEAEGVLENAVILLQFFLGPLHFLDVVDLVVMDAQLFEGFLVFAAAVEELLDQFKIVALARGGGGGRASGGLGAGDGRQQCEGEDREQPPRPAISHHAFPHVPSFSVRRQSIVFARAADSAEYHASGRGLQDAGDGNRHVLPDRRPALLDHDHRAVVQIADPLADLIALLDDLHCAALLRAARPTSRRWTSSFRLMTSTP